MMIPTTCRFAFSVSSRGPVTCDDAESSHAMSTSTRLKFTSLSLCRLSTSILELDRADHTDARVASASGCRLARSSRPQRAWLLIWWAIGIGRRTGLSLWPRMIPAGRCPNTPLYGAQIGDVAAIGGCRPIVASTAPIRAERAAGISRTRRTPPEPILLECLQCGPPVEIWYCATTFEQRHIDTGEKCPSPPSTTLHVGSPARLAAS
jgi:hypothetical protein